MARLIVIGGPTASGKTALAIEVAQHFGTEIISADSRQFYQEMRIGNARPEPEELAAVPHHFIADHSIMDPLTAGIFAEKALTVLLRLFAKNEVVVLVGGSGLYIDALCKGLDAFPPVGKEAKEKVAAMQQEQGLEGLQKALQQLDPVYYERVDRQNPRRLIRALEVCYSSGQAYSGFRQQAGSRDFDCHYFQPKPGRLMLPDPEKLPPRMRPTPERAWLYERINRRVNLMMEAGLEAEASSLHSFRTLPVLQTVGYQEFWPYLAGEYDLKRVVELIQQNSRRYAKRQLTWFGREGKYREVSGVDELIATGFGV